MVHRGSNIPAFLSVEEYLARERVSPRCEYVAGEVYAMSPVSPRHSTITFNIAHHLRDATVARGCRLFGDVLTKVAEDRYYYPDIVVTCAPVGPDDVIEAPCFVVEVTSPSTRSTDLREKPAAYRSAPTVQGVLLVEQKRRHVILDVRMPQGHWARTELTDAGTLTIPCIDANLTLGEIYETLDFPLRVREGDEFTVEEYGREWVLVRADTVS